MKSIAIEVRTPSGMVPLLAEYEEQMDAVQRRAYHLFENRSFEHGRDLDDWLEAQAQTVCFPHVETEDHATHYVVLTSLGGFTTDFIRVIVSPHDMLLRAEAPRSPRKKRGEVSLKALTYYRFPLPIDTATVEALLTDGVLRISLPKLSLSAAI